MASFYIPLLFTNIPEKDQRIAKKRLSKTFNIISNSWCFVFNNVYYQQVDGVDMGSPMGPTLVNLFLVYSESKRLAKCPVQFKPKYYHRYVDHIILMFKRKDHVKKFFKLDIQLLNLRVRRKLRTKYL